MKHAILALALCAVAVPAVAQDTDMLAWQTKQARLDLMPRDLPTQQLVFPSEQTADRPLYGFRLMVGAVYHPSIFDDESWIQIACIGVDPHVVWDDDVHGFSLIRVHALIYEQNRDGTLNADTRISTVDTEESDEGICNLSRGLDTSFIEIPRDFEVAAVSLFSYRSSRQHAEVVENFERAIIRPAPPEDD